MNDAVSEANGSPAGETCEATKGFIRACDDTMQAIGDPAAGDGALIAAAQRIARDGLAGYGNLWQRDGACRTARHVRRAREKLRASLEEAEETVGKLAKLARGGMLKPGISLS